MLIQGNWGAECRLVNSLFFLLALFGMAVEADFLVVQVVNALDVNGAARCGFDRDGGFLLRIVAPVRD